MVAGMGIADWSVVIPRGAAVTRPRQRQDRSRRSGHAHSKNTQDYSPQRFTMQQRAAWKFCQVAALLSAEGDYYDMLPPSARMATDAVKQAAALLAPSLLALAAALLLTPAAHAAPVPRVYLPLVQYMPAMSAESTPAQPVVTPTPEVQP